LSLIISFTLGNLSIAGRNFRLRLLCQIRTRKLVDIA
jgi:hypothetical protein